jgi:hypothetical protein
MKLKAIVPAVMLVMAAAVVAARAEGPTISVIKSKTCGCCSMWLEHLKANGFTVKAEDVEDLYERKDKLKIPSELQSCHTGVVDGYIIEGHVPAEDIVRLLKEKPKALGLAVPGMPMGSPGMDMGSKKDAFKVVLFTEDGKTSLWHEYPGN